ncbi:hypothetical protein ACIGO9_31005 [Nocardia asteroides]
MRAIITTKVVVIGGGYVGALAANHLRLRDDIDITLIGWASAGPGA